MRNELPVRRIDLLSWQPYMKPTGKRLGELVLRTANVDKLTEFYRDVIGLEPYASFGSNRFFKVADDIEGHPQMLAIFEKAKEFSGPKEMDTEQASSATGTLHHFAFALQREDFDRETRRLQERGLDLQFEQYEVFGWRSIHFHDPDGNSVEFVCHDPTILDAEENKRVRHASGS